MWETAISAVRWLRRCRPGDANKCAADQIGAATSGRSVNIPSNFPDNIPLPDSKHTNAVRHSDMAIGLGLAIGLHKNDECTVAPADIGRRQIFQVL